MYYEYLLYRSLLSIFIYHIELSDFFIEAVLCLVSVSAVSSVCYKGNAWF